MLDLQMATARDFDELSDKAFAVIAPELEVRLELIEVKPLGSGMRDGGAFALLWQGPGAPALSQATYRLSHAALGELDLFLVPVAQFEDGFRYEAIFT